MYKSIFMYSLLALVYFGFSILPLREVSAQSIAIHSGNNQSVRSGQKLPKTLQVSVTGITSTIKLQALAGLDVEVSFTGDFTDKDFEGKSDKTGITSDGNHDIHVRIKPFNDQRWFRDSFTVTVAIGDIESSDKVVYFSGKITDALYFSSASTTRSVAEDTVVGAPIGTPISAIYPKRIDVLNQDNDPNDDFILRYSLEGTDRDSFRINGNTGQLSLNTPLDYYIKSTYSVTVKAIIYKKVGGQTSSSATIAVRINVNEPELTIIENERLTVRRIDSRTVMLEWDIPTELNTQTITGYQYSIDGGLTWTSTGSTNTSITLTHDGIGDLSRDKLKIRAISRSADRSRYAVIFARPRIIIQECPVGWQRTDSFAQPNPRVLLYEVNLEMDLHNRVSIYKPDWVAIYVHPDEGLENLDGWKLKVAVPYNHHRDYLLTAENSVVVDANIEGVEGGFAFIESPEEAPFPMVGMGFTGATVPGFDYRLYDDTGRKVDFGIACYKQGGIFQALKDMEDPRVLRNVLLESLDWDAATYIRSEWTVPTPAPAAPSQVKGNIVGTWANLKKQ